MTSAPQSRYPHPKSLPSGEGLAIALTGSNAHIDVHENPDNLENHESLERTCENLKQIRIKNNGPETKVRSRY